MILSVAAFVSVSSIFIPPGNSRFLTPDEAKDFNNDPEKGRAATNNSAMVVISMPRLGQNIWKNNSMIAQTVIAYFIFSKVKAMSPLFKRFVRIASANRREFTSVRVRRLRLFSVLKEKLVSPEPTPTSDEAFAKKLEPWQELHLTKGGNDIELAPG